MSQLFRWPLYLMAGVTLLVIAAGCQRGPSNTAPEGDSPRRVTTPPKANLDPPAYRDVNIVAVFNPGPESEELSWNTQIDYLGRVDQQSHDPNPGVLGENFSTRSLPALEPRRLAAVMGRIESSGFFGLQSDYPARPNLPVAGPSWTLSAKYERHDGTWGHRIVAVTGDGGNHPDVAKFWVAWKAVLDVAPPPVRGKR